MASISRLGKVSLVPGICFLSVFLILVLLSGDPSFDTATSPWKIAGDLLWIVGQAGVLIILSCMNRLHMNGQRWYHKLTLIITAIGAMSYIMGTIWNTELVMRAFCTTPMFLFFPVGAFLSALGMLCVGIQIILRNDHGLTGWKKFTPFLVGVYPFVVMFPVVIMTGEPNVYLIMLWGVPWLIFGVALKKLVSG
jgi:hypothetical protein